MYMTQLEEYGSINLVVVGSSPIQCRSLSFSTTTVCFGYTALPCSLRYVLVQSRAHKPSLHFQAKVTL